MYWIILANSNMYRIYLYKRKTNELSLLKEELHPKSKAKESQLITDRPGRYKTSHQTRGAYARGAYAWHTDPKQNEIDHFLKSLADELEIGRSINQYEKLVLIAPPHVSGTILKHLDKNVEPLLFNNIKKDYTHFEERDLSKFLHEEWLSLVAEKEKV